MEREEINKLLDELWETGVSGEEADAALFALLSPEQADHLLEVLAPVMEAEDGRQL